MAINYSDFFFFALDGKRYLFHGPSCLIFDISSTDFDSLESSLKFGRSDDSVEVISESIAQNKKKIQYSKDQFEFKPNCLVLNVSGKCNLSCRYCFSQDINGFKFKSMTQQECLDAVSFMIKNNPAEKNFTVSFFGGEPLMERSTVMAVVPAIISAYPDKSFFFSITTNGTIMDESFASFIKEYNISVLVSFDGPKDLVALNRPHKDARIDTYTQIMRCADILKQKNIPFDFRATVVASDCRLMDIVELFESLKVPYYLVPCFSSGNSNSGQFSDWNEKILDDFIREYRKVLSLFISKISRKETVFCHSFYSRIKLAATQFISRYSCGVGSNLFSVTHGGNMFSCMNLATHPETTIGNIYSGLNRDAWKRYVPFDVENQKECADCLIRYQCSGGCLSERYDPATRSAGLPDENMCKLKRAMWQETVKAFQTIKNHYPEILDSLPDTITVE